MSINILGSTVIIETASGKVRWLNGNARAQEGGELPPVAEVEYSRDVIIDELREIDQCLEIDRARLEFLQARIFREY